MLDDVWPLFGLSIETAGLRLRLPDDSEVGQLARLAARGVHAPHERPFLTPWAEGTPESRARYVLQSHWEKLGTWEEQDWALGLGVFADGEPIGVVTLRAQQFAVVREVTTTSWLGLAHQRRGFGTQARAGVLALAFDHLGAEAAVTEVFGDNHASQGVSRTLGYVHDGISRDARDGEVLVSDRLRLTRGVWESRDRPPAVVNGVEPCRAMFGL